MNDAAIPPQPPPWGINLPWSWIVGGDPEYAALVTELRGFLDDLAGAHPEPSHSAALAGILRDWRARLRETATGEHAQVFGRRPDLPGRGHTMLPYYVARHVTHEAITADVRFGRYYLGAGQAVHGGAIPMVFDELFGTLVNHEASRFSRTANLSVNFRSLTPLDRDLTLSGEVVRVEGRKTYVSGRLTDGERLCADADALFVALPGGLSVEGEHSRPA